MIGVLSSSSGYTSVPQSFSKLPAGRSYSSACDSAAAAKLNIFCQVFQVGKMQHRYSNSSSCVDQERVCEHSHHSVEVFLEVKVHAKPQNGRSPPLPLEADLAAWLALVLVRPADDDVPAVGISEDVVGLLLFDASRRVSFNGLLEKTIHLMEHSMMEYSTEHLRERSMERSME